jgi:hypothetical protein
MGRLRYYTTENGLVVFENRSTLRSVSVWEDDLRAIQEVCAWCSDTRTSALGRVAHGRYSPALLTKALHELEQTRDRLDPDTLPDDDAKDDYIDLLTAIDDLRGVITRIKKIA